jgi:predicted nucleic acid-binding Zn ribbon protein
MRRPAPRPIAAALDGYAREAAPATLLARVQGSWPEVAGEVVAAEARPASERAGTVTFSCTSGVWANELDLLSSDLLERLNAALAGTPGEPVRALRFRVL